MEPTNQIAIAPCVSVDSWAWWKVTNIKALLFARLPKPRQLWRQQLPLIQVQPWVFLGNIWCVVTELSDCWISLTWSKTRRQGLKAWITRFETLVGTCNRGVVQTQRYPRLRLHRQLASRAHKVSQHGVPGQGSWGELNYCETHGKCKDTPSGF